MKPFKRCLTLLIALVLTLCGLPAFAEGGEAGVTLTDQGGFEVTVPPSPSRVVIAGLPPFTSFYLQFVGDVGSLAGMPAWSVNEPVWVDRVFPGLDQVATVGAGPNFEVEEVLALSPDLIFCSTGAEEKYLALRESGIPTIGLDSTAEGINTLETAKGWFALLGQAFGMEEKADALIAYTDMIASDVAERLSGLQTKKTGLMLPDYSENALEVSNDEYYGGFWLEMGGLENVAKDVVGWNASMEEILAWNPDVIFLSAFSEYTPAQMMADDAVPGHTWSGTRAGADGAIYKFPVGLFNWYALSPDAALSLLWQASSSYPELFADVAMTTELKDYYALFGIDLTDAEAAAVLGYETGSSVGRVPAGSVEAPLLALR